MLQGFKAVPPLVTDINLSLDDQQLYVSCWGTGELRQYDVTDPFTPRLTATTQIGGIVRRAAHPAQPGKRLNGGPQMVELSRDGRRVYLTNGLYSPWDEQFYPDGAGGLDGEARRPARRAGWRWTRSSSWRWSGAPLPPGPAPGRRRLFRLVLLLVDDRRRTRCSWPALLALGAGHGINPAMGWLFAVALGLQRGSRRAVWGALGPLGAGHAAAIAVTLVAAGLIGLVIPLGDVAMGHRGTAGRPRRLPAGALAAHHLRRDAGERPRAGDLGRFSWPRRTAPG